METTPQTQNHNQLSRPQEGQPSPGGESGRSIAVVQPRAQEPDMVPIHARFYQMLLKGDTAAIENEISTNPSFRNFSNLVWEPDNSSVLHIAASAGQVNLVHFICNRDQRLLHFQNSEGDIPIHVATRAGHQFVVKSLVLLGGNQIIERENEEKNTALHIALENQHEGLARWLFQRCPETTYHLNLQGICPLYLAIKSRFWGLVWDMLAFEVEQPHLVEHALRETRSSVVHAAIMARNQELVAALIAKYHDLLYSFDEFGRTTCSYAAYMGFLDGVTYFLHEHPQEALELNKDGSFPIHIACIGGSLEVVKEFLTQSPDTKWLLNKKRQNILHVAASSGSAKVVKYLLRQCELDALINTKDQDGNTPLHLASMGKHAKVVYTFTRDKRVMLMLQNRQGLTALDLAEDYRDIPSLEERLTWLALIYANAPRSPLRADVDQYVMASNESQRIDRTSVPSTRHQGSPLPKKKKNYKDKLNTLLMVSTLIATMTFAAGFTVPGGYDSSDQHTNHEGMATLARRHAFQVFVLSDMVALYSSIFAAVTLIWAHLDDPKLSLTSLDFALPSLTIALSMMSVAFMTGLFVALHGVCDWLAFVVFILGCAFLPLVLVVFVPLYFPSPSVKNKLVRYIFHITFTFMLSICDRRGNIKNVE